MKLSEPKSVFFENTNIKEVNRSVSSDGTIFLIVEQHLSFEEQITKKAKTQIYLVKEDDLEQSSIDFLRTFMPEDNKVESLIQRMDQEKGEKQGFIYELEIEVS